MCFVYPKIPIRWRKLLRLWNKLKDLNNSQQLAGDNTDVTMAKR